MANEFPIYNGYLQNDVDANGFGFSNLGDTVMSAGDFQLFQDPTAALHAATKQYVDNARFPLNELTDWADDANQQAGSLVLRNAADNGWTDGGDYIWWDDTNEALSVVGAQPYQLSLKGGNTSGYNVWQMGGLGGTNGLGITAVDDTAVEPDRLVFSVEDDGIVNIGHASERLNLYANLDATNGYGINAFQRLFVETAAPSIYLKQSAALGTYKYAELAFTAADRFRIYVENLNPPSVVSILDLDDAASTASFGAIAQFNAPIIAQGTTSDYALINEVRGEIYQNDTAATTALTLQNTWYPVLTTWTDSGDSLQVTVTTGTGRLTPAQAGVYLIIWRVAGSTDGTNQQLEGCAYLNGTTEIPNTTNEDRFATAGETYELAGHGIYRFNGTTDYVQVALNNNTSAGKTFTVDHATLTVLRIGKY